MHRGDTLARSELDKPQARSAAWSWIKRGVGAAFLLLVAVMIVRYARSVNWDEVWASVRALPLSVIAQAAALAALSYLLYSCFDLFGRRYTGHGVSAARTMQIAFISYAFNLNMGSTVGGVGMRLRLYSHHDVGAVLDDIAAEREGLRRFGVSKGVAEAARIVGAVAAVEPRQRDFLGRRRQREKGAERQPECGFHR